MKRPRIALIHAVHPAIAPIRAAFASDWPEAEAISLLDDSLSIDRAKDAGVTPAMMQRFTDLTDYIIRQGADAILFTCSAFGPAIEHEARTRRLPILKPNEAMFDAAFATGTHSGPLHVGMIATFGPSVSTMEAEFAEESARRKLGAKITTVLVPAARQALDAGDLDAHNRLVADAVQKLGAVDAIMLAHFSTAPAAAAVRAVATVPVLTAPNAAVAALKARLGV
jgi:Asp/Glu/hydantoin racemase